MNTCQALIKRLKSLPSYDGHFLHAKLHDIDQDPSTATLDFKVVLISLETRDKLIALLLEQEALISTYP